MGDLIVDIHSTPSPRVEFFDPATFEHWEVAAPDAVSMLMAIFGIAADRGAVDIYLDRTGVGLGVYAEADRRIAQLGLPFRLHPERWSAGHADDERLVDVTAIQRIEPDLVAVTGQRATGHPTQLLLRLPPRVAQALELAEKVGIS